VSAVEVLVGDLGAAGDGIAITEQGPVYIAYAAVGDRLRVVLGPRRGEGREGRIVARLADGPGRVAPPCPHFGTCGGCALQHLDDATVSAWKRDRVVRALAARGLASVEVGPTVPARAATRRRLGLAVDRAAGRVRLGFHPRFGRDVVDVTACPVAAPELVALLAPMRAGLGRIAGWRKGQAIATLTETGIDLVLALGLAPSIDTLARLAALADTADLARLSLSREGMLEPVVVRRAPRVTFGTVAVEPPPGGFLQPTRDGEAAIGALILAATQGAGRVADLYAGCGTWSFRLAEGSQVLAVEADAALTAALAAAADRVGLAGRVRVETRDLARRPLLADELARFDAVVFDPPRAGAAEQAAALAGSRVARVIAVSCNPATFARDARVLVDGGYRLERVMPVDQFLWSPHVELVAAFAR
jgi:23S rRNA (uracil1939-C5)-methyltransferase